MPSITDYKKTIVAGGCFQKLASLTPVMSGKKQKPVFCAGNFGGVFQCEDDKQRRFAVKCFTQENPDRIKRFSAISADLKQLKSPHIVRYDFFNDEINVGGKLFPALVMPWIEGQTIRPILKKACVDGDVDTIKNILRLFIDFCEFLRQNGIGHGDLKDDNLIITPTNEIVGIDYDGMFVPSLAGEEASELGTPGYQHPLRSRNHFSEKLDWFSIQIMTVALKALMIRPDLYAKYDTGQNMLFRKTDLKDPANSELFQELEAMGDPEVSDLLAMIEKSLSTGDVEGNASASQTSPKPTRPQPQPNPKKTKPTTPTAPLADFSVHTTSGTAPLTVIFDNQSVGDISEYAWIFGDGNTSAEKNPMHTYINPGIYTVILTVKGPGGEDRKIMTDHIGVQQKIHAPKANFDFEVDQNDHSRIEFTNNSTGATTFHWDFGDLNTSVEPDPTHKYNSNGNYLVVLTAVGPGGTNSATKTVRIKPAAPNASFNFFPKKGRIPLVVNFSNTSRGDITGYKWDFGDGNFSNDENPTHIYNSPGDHTITLEVTGPGGNDVYYSSIKVKGEAFSKKAKQLTENTSKNATKAWWYNPPLWIGILFVIILMCI